MFMEEEPGQHHACMSGYFWEHSVEVACAIQRENLEKSQKNKMSSE